MAGGTRTVQSVERAVEILFILSRHPRGLGLSEVAEQVGLRPQTAQSLLRTLEGLDMIAQKAKRAPYVLGPEAIALGRRWMAGNGHVEAARPVVRDLGRHLNEHVLLASLRGGSLYRLAETSPDQMVTISPSYASHAVTPTMATVKVLLAYASPDGRDEALEQMGFASDAPAREEYFQELNEVRDKGYALSINETADDLTAVAVPVMGEAGRAETALGVAMPTARCPADRRDELLEKLQSSARQIAGKWGLGQ
mgnify:CR=1 FL=1